MKRLVYSPTVKAWVKTDFGVVDLSPYITECQIQRKINDVSTVSIVFRNPKVTEDGKQRFMFTQKVQSNGSIGPMFHPMDPITVILERIPGRPIQAFTGYCDAVPYVQLFPGTAKITASCTLKRLLFTFWDPALPFVSKFMENYGWLLGTDGTARKGNGQNTAADDKLDAVAEREGNAAAARKVNLNDGSISNLLYAVLNEVGGWDNSNIYIQPLPQNIGSIVSKLYEEFTEDNKKINEDIAKVLKEIVGSGQFGGAIAGGGSDGAATSSGNLPAYTGKQGKLSVTEAKAAAKSMLDDFGWPESEWSALEQLWEHESSWRWDSAWTPGSTADAYGIPQANPGNKMASAGSDWETNAVTQIKWGLNYIKERYGSPTAAWAFWQNPTSHPTGATTHWY